MRRAIAILPFYLFTLLLLLSACSAESEYTTWPCRFAYDNSIHLDQTLATATDINVRGIFCKVTESTEGGAKYLNFQNSDGLVSSQRETAEELRMEYRIGLNNGIIIGFQTMNDSPNGGFVAYDIQCPNCVREYDNYVAPNYIVDMNNKGVATCRKCKRQYQLNNGGIIINGKEGDVGLERYRNAITAGPQGTTSVFP